MTDAEAARRSMLVDDRRRPLDDGQAAAQCSARSKRSGARCRRTPMLGQNVCYNHGGATPAALAAAKRRLALAEAGKLLGVAKDVDPGEALLDAAQLAAGDVDALRRNLPDEMTIDTALGKAVDVRVKLYHEAIERSARLNKLAIDAGLAERLVRLRELEAAKIVSLLERLIDDPTLGLSPAQRAQARLVARRELLRLAGRNAVIELGDVRVIEGDTP